MKNTDEFLFAAGETVEYARQYIEQQGEYIRLEAAERIAKVFSALASTMVIAFFGALVLVMLSLSFGLWLGTAVGSNALAFLLVALLYIAAAMLIFLFRKTWIVTPILTLVLNAFFERTEQKENGEMRN